MLFLRMPDSQEKYRKQNYIYVVANFKKLSNEILKPKFIEIIMHNSFVVFI